ncbi:carbon-nitrogen hydrolase family protein [Actinocorallia sp. A-T 12471]|uniref:carbon-nitrogen hydrolase family protein n=1 Tax=Actinocorallia sp. A-T 12471 TaxID=3089813 RepID=UPI0029CD1FED|nr:carbon-nitrogen hydrolase family protein [Actinocorallia sp. A-T 12471]MDX6744064.1 carbon-nitrogen hydrolase family protein [Actinocorallia sp. A-T 12471]
MAVVRVAAAQFFSGADPEANLALCAGYVREAAAQGARLVVLPENANRVRDYGSREECYERSEALDGPFVTGLRALAAELGVYVAAGVDLRGDASPVVHIGSVLVGPDGALVGVHHKHVLWDYEYTLFTPGDHPYEVFDTEIGRIGLLLCADGIVPDTPRALALMGAQILCNSLNSRGPDEYRVHVPLRALENRVWHVAANTVGGPEHEWPWMGGSQIVAPDGTRLADAGEDEPGLIVADIDPAMADDKVMPGVGDLFGWRRPDLYGVLTQPLADVPAAAMYGPAPADMPPRPLPVALLQVSFSRNTEWTVLRALGQVAHAARQGARLGVLPELFCLAPGEAAADPAKAAGLSRDVLQRLAAACAEHKIWVAASLVEAEGDRYYSSVYLLDDTGAVAHRYRKTHLTDADRAWATPGDSLAVADTALGRIGFMVGEEVWAPEVARVLAVNGAELIAHPTSWTTPEAMHVAATERTEENRVHLVSVTRLDAPAGLGSQIVRADDFVPGQPIALMRYPSGYWTRPGFEEQLVMDLDLRESNDKMMGHHLDPLATRAPQLYGSFTA